jgi:hypothetical protein
MLPFAVSIGCLSLAQAAVVAAPRRRPFAELPRLRSRWWAAVLPLSIAAVVFGIRASGATADALTYLALIAVPPLAAVALAFAVRGARPALAPAVVPLFVIAWAARQSLVGEAAALLLAALSCVTLAGLLAELAPARWLKAGIVVMALIDTALVVADLLQAPNRVLDAAAPGAGLPQLQRVAFGSALMGYGDLFIAATLGAVLAASWPVQRRAALLAGAIALLFDLLFFVATELPATVPVAAALIVVERSARAGERRRAGRRNQPARLAPLAARRRES